MMYIKIALSDLYFLTEEDGSLMSPAGDISDTTAIQDSLAEAGLPKPIEVTPDDQTAGYLVLEGEEYVVAARQLGWKEIDALVVPPLSNKRDLRLYILRSFMRRNPKPVAFAKALKRMVSDGMEKETLRRVVGLKKITELELYLDILDAPVQVQKRIDFGELSMQTWKEIRNKPKQTQLEIAGLDAPTLRAARKVMRKEKGKEKSQAGIFQSAFEDTVGVEREEVRAFIAAAQRIKIVWERLSSDERLNINERCAEIISSPIFTDKELEAEYGG